MELADFQKVIAEALEKFAQTYPNLIVMPDTKDHSSKNEIIHVYSPLPGGQSTLFQIQLTNLSGSNKSISESMTNNLVWAMTNNKSLLVKVILEDKDFIPEKGRSQVLTADEAIGFNSSVYIAFDDIIRKGFLEIFKLLLADSRFILVKDDRYLVDTILQGQFEMTQMLLVDGRIDPGNDNDRAIAVAANRGDVRTIEMLIADPRVDPSAGNNWAIGQACAGRGNTYIEVLKALLNDPRVDPSANNNEVLYHDIENASVSEVEFLLSLPQIVAVTSHSEAMVHALKREDSDIFRHLFHHPHTDVNIITNQDIYDACSKGKIKNLKVILADGRIFDGSEGRGIVLAPLLECTMYHAARDRQWPVVELLLRDGRFNPTYSENVVIKEAAKQKVEHVVILLIEDGRIFDRPLGQLKTYVDRLLQQRWAKQEAVVWVTKEIEGGWADIGTHFTSYIQLGCQEPRRVLTRSEEMRRKYYNK